MLAEMVLRERREPAGLRAWVTSFTRGVAQALQAVTADPAAAGLRAHMDQGGQAEMLATWAHQAEAERTANLPLRHRTAPLPMAVTAVLDQAGVRAVLAP